MPTIKLCILAVTLLVVACSGLPTRNTIEEPQHSAEVLPNPFAENSYQIIPPVSIETTPPASDTNLVSAQKPVKVNDIWQRLTLGLNHETHSQRSEVQLQIKRYVTHPKFFNKTTRRATPFLHMILEELDRRNLPYELALLPIVESEYRARSFSRRGAAGLWQFIPTTGQAYGLRNDWWYDGRLDIHASTLAALDYLQTLNTRFKGDWLLALAAYNAGPTRVQGAINKNIKQNRPTDFWNLSLPLETRHYVPRLLALSTILKDSSQHGITLEPADNRPRLARVQLGGQIDLTLASQLAEVELATILELNPCFKRWATAPDGPHHMLLPIEAAKRLDSNLKTVPAEKRISWAHYKIRRGDSLIRIARKYNVSVSFIKQKNNLSSNRIIAGKHLIVPGNAAINLATTIQNPVNSEKRVHVVSRGESLWAIARANQTSVNHLVKLNKLDRRHVLRPGDKLVLPTSARL